MCTGLLAENGGGAAAETKTYTYVVEGRQVLNETANFPEEGGKVFDKLTSSAYLGTVKTVGLNLPGSEFQTVPQISE